MAEKDRTLMRDLTAGSVPKQLLLFAAPLLLSGLLQTLYNLADAAIVGRLVGSSCLAGVAIGGDILHVLTFTAMGFSNAGQVLIAQYTGARQYDKVYWLIGTLFTFLTVCAGVITVCCLLFRVPILHAVHTPEDAWPHAMAYSATCYIGTVFIYGYNVVSAILRGMGNSRHPFLFIALAAISNIILDLLFVGAFHLAAFGAALATVIAQGGSFLLAAAFLYRRRMQFGFDFQLRSFRIHRSVFLPLLQLGVPMALQSASITLAKLFVSANVNTYGVLAAAVTGIGNKLDAAAVAVTGALNTAGASMIGQSIGAQKYDRVLRIVGAAFLYAVIICCAMCAVLLHWPKGVFGLFIRDEQTLNLAMAYVPVAALCLLSCAARQPMMALIYGSGHPRMNLAVAVLDGVVGRVGLSLLLGEALRFGIYGYWYGNALSGFIPFFIGGAYYLSGAWKNNHTRL